MDAMIEHNSETEIILAEHAEVIRTLGRRVVGDVLEIGRRLAACKAEVGHGNWLPWLEREFGWSEQSALNFIRVHEMASKSKNFLDLSLPVSALYLLAAPSTPEEVRTEVIELSASERLTHQQVKDMIDKAVEASREKDAALREELTAKVAAAEMEANRREEAVRAEFAGKIMVEEGALERQIQAAVQPLMLERDEAQEELAKIKEREKKRREKAKKQLEQQSEEHVATSKVYHSSTSVRLCLQDLHAALHVTPQQLIDTELHLAEMVGQTKKARLGRALEEAKTVSDWLKQFIALMEKAK